MRKKYRFILETVYYSLCAIAFLGIKFFCSIPDAKANIIYMLYIIISFGYLIGLDLSGIKHDPALHAKQLEKNYKAKEHLNPETEKFNRGKLKNVIVLWIAYLAAVGVLRFADLLDWTTFLCGISILLGLNSYFCRKSCWLSKVFLKKNGCCADCGINGWDLAIFASALIFAPYLSVEASILNGIIILTAYIKLTVWEYRYHKYPQRFHKKTNADLSCANCVKNCGKIKESNENTCVKIFQN